MNEFYNKHYITINEQGRITDAWSDGAHLKYAQKDREVV